MAEALNNSQMEILNTMALAVMDMVKTASDWVTFAFDAPFARADVFGVRIGGILSNYQNLMEYITVLFSDNIL